MPTASPNPPEYRGHVANGVVVFDEPAPLPDGTEVRVAPSLATSVTASSAAQAPTWYECLKPLIGSVKGKPPDWAENHDHYVHGTRKRS